MFKRKSTLDKIMASASRYSFCDEQRMKSLAHLAAQMTEKNIEGDFVECGSYKGGTSALLSRFMGPRHIWIYDSFQGMPPTTKQDGPDAQKYVGEGACSPEDVRDVMKLVGTDPKQFTIKKGWFNDTFKESSPAKISFLHCDCDWYESVMLTLETFYPRVSPGGCIVLDDFGYWEGCREAFYDFCSKTGEKPLLERVGITQAYWFKGQTSNRT